MTNVLDDIVAGVHERELFRRRVNRLVGMEEVAQTVQVYRRVVGRTLIDEQPDVGKHHPRNEDWRA